MCVCVHLVSFSIYTPAGILSNVLSYPTCMYLGFVVVTGLKFHVDDWREKKRMMGLVHVDEVL